MSIVYDKNDSSLADGQKNETGQHSVYPALSPEERAKCFVRPVRQTYVHVGKKIERDEEGRIVGKLVMIGDPDYPEHDYYTKEHGYGGFIQYPESKLPLTGRYVSQKEIDAIVARKSHFGGCGVATKMGLELAETYARDPKFYGATFCVGCNKHLPVDEFVWEGTDEIVGS